MNIGDMVYIQSFKHDGSLHRTWSKGCVIEANEKVWVLVTYKTLVVESNQRIWQTREPAICFFYPDRWFNVIAMIRKAGITYYCNIASPSLYDGEAIKNIDYDLDLKVFPNGAMEILDENEFEVHSKKMNYSDEIIEIVRKELDNLIELATKKEECFNEDVINHYYMRYLKMDRKRLK